MAIPISTEIFGQTTTDTPRPMTVNGMPGWWSVPRHWYARQIANTPQWEVGESADFSGTLFVAVLADDLITMVFQDPMRDRIQEMPY